MSIKAKKNRRRELWERDPRCCYCGRRLAFEEATLEHRIPQARGGDNSPENLAVACERCNLDKGAATPDEYALKLARRKRERRWPASTRQSLFSVEMFIDLQLQVGQADALETQVAGILERLNEHESGTGVAL